MRLTFIRVSFNLFSGRKKIPGKAKITKNMKNNANIYAAQNSTQSTYTGV